MKVGYYLEILIRFNIPNGVVFNNMCKGYR